MVMRPTVCGPCASTCLVDMAVSCDPRHEADTLHPVLTVLVNPYHHRKLYYRSGRDSWTAYWASGERGKDRSDGWYWNKYTPSAVISPPHHLAAPGDRGDVRHTVSGHGTHSSTTR